jgi:sugar phosphate isomerase/epimerase
MRYRAHMSTRDLSRRDFLSITAAAPFALSAALKSADPKPVGLELYSVRTELAKDLLGTVSAVGKMGYQVVEFYSPYMQWTPDRAKEVRKVLDDSGLKCLSTHNGTQSLSYDGLQKAIELNQIIGSKYIIIASAQAKTVDDWKGFAAQLAQASERLKAAGMATGFHNHQTEWKPIDGQRPMDILAANTPKDVVLQFDVGTCLEAGADPLAWIKANPGRIKSAHCKEWSPEKGYDVAFGEGAAPWKALLDALEKTGGIEYYLIEQETGAQHPDGELGMVQRCIDNWNKLAR